MDRPKLRTVGRRVLPGVGWVRGPLANLFVVREATGTYLIDTGFPDNAAPVRNAFRLAHVPLKRISQILLTHQHPDHMGGAAYLRWVTGARVAAHEMDTPSVEGHAPMFAPLPVRLLFGRHPVRVDRALKDGDTVGPFTAVHTPGHTLGSVCYYHAERKLLFVGDVLVVTPGGLRQAYGFSNFDPDQALDSLEKIAALDVQAIFSGHGRPLVKDASAALKATTRRLTQVRERPWWTLVGPTGMAETHPHLPAPPSQEP